MSYPEFVSNIERRIITRILKRALAKGYSITVNDGEEDVVTSTDLATLQAEIGHTCETYLIIKDVGWIWLVHGNEEDVVTDCVENEFIAALVAE